MNRWNKLDSLLKQSKPKIHNEFMSILDDLVALFDELNILNSPGFNLNQNVPKSLKTKVKNKIKQWQKDGILYDYFLYKVSSLKYTYKDVIKILIYGIYAEKEKNINNISFDVLSNIAKHSFDIAKKESNKKPLYNTISSKLIKSWSVIPIVALSYVEYISLLSQTAVDEIFKIFSANINSGEIIDENKLIKVINKQEHRVLSINESDNEEENDKFSGILETTSVGVANKAYFEPFPNEKCVFIAQKDDRTTKMCLSLDGQIFNTKDTNIFYRYSDSAQAYIKYEIDGLVEGINLPPINDHFHYCRSTISYQIDVDIEKLRSKIFETSYKYDISEDYYKNRINISKYNDLLSLRNEYLYLNEERKNHIYANHKDAVEYLKYYKDVILKQDNIYKDTKYKNTYWFVKEIKGVNLKATVKLLDIDEKNKNIFYNSLLTYQIMNKQRIKKALKKKRIVLIK